MNKITLKDLSVKHDYYASRSNFYNKECNEAYDTWQSFYDEYKDADIDMNLVFRWDIHEYDNANSFWMEIIIIQQRKGIYFPIYIRNVFEQDVQQIVEFMKPHFDKLKKNWKPLSNFYLSI